LIYFWRKQKTAVYLQWKVSGFKLHHQQLLFRRFFDFDAKLEFLSTSCKFFGRVFIYPLVFLDINQQV